MISVVIPAYNEAKIIHKCLDAFTRQTYRGKYEIILVDNASTDQTAQIAAKYKKNLPIRIIRQSSKGRGIARHTGFMAAKGEIILSTDADCIVPPDWIASMVKMFNHSICGVVTGTCKTIESSKIKRIPSIIAYEAYQYAYRFLAGHYAISGANFGIKRDLYHTSGGFDINLNAAEDLDLAKKVSRHEKIIHKNIPVYVSMRRFDQSAIDALIDYAQVHALYFLSLRNRITLSDTR